MTRFDGASDRLRTSGAGRVHVNTLVAAAYGAIFGDCNDEIKCNCLEQRKYGSTI
jgi:hypothetical protein